MYLLIGLVVRAPAIRFNPLDKRKLVTWFQTGDPGSTPGSGATLLLLYKFYFIKKKDIGLLIQGSNLGPSNLQSDALPAELIKR